MTNPFLAAINRADGPHIPRLALLFLTREAARRFGRGWVPSPRQIALENAAHTYPLPPPGVERTKMLMAARVAGLVTIGDPPALTDAGHDLLAPFDRVAGSIDFNNQRFLELVHATGKDPAARSVLLDWCEEQGWIRQADDLAPRRGTWADFDGRLLDQNQTDALIEREIVDNLMFDVPIDLIEGLLGNRLRSPMMTVGRDTLSGEVLRMKARSQHGGIHSDPLVRALQRQLIGDPVAGANPRRLLIRDLDVMSLAPRDDS